MVLRWLDLWTLVCTSIKKCAYYLIYPHRANCLRVVSRGSKFQRQLSGTTAKCVFWLLIRNAHFALRSVHIIEVLAYFESHAPCYIDTSDRSCDSCSRAACCEMRHGCVWVACQSNMTCHVYVSIACNSTLYYRWKWLVRSCTLAPYFKTRLLMPMVIHETDFVAWLCENAQAWKTVSYDRDLRCAYPITFCDVIWHTNGPKFA